MKYEIKQLNNTDAVIISDEEIKEGAVKEIYLEYISPPQSYLRIFEFGTLKQLFIQKNINIGNCGWRKKVIATISPYKLEGLPMLELPNQEEDVEKLFKDKYKSFRTGSFLKQIKEYFAVQLMMIGYKAAQKQYSEEDIRNAIEMAREVSGMEALVKLLQNEYLSTEDFQYTKEEIIQSLQKKQFPIAVELTEDFKIIK